MITAKEIAGITIANEMFWCSRRNKVMFRIVKSYRFELSNGHIITVPRDYETDFRSSPNPADRKTIAGKALAWVAKRIVELVVPQIGRHNAAVLIHDYLYTDGRLKYTRAFADLEMLYWLVKCEVKAVQRKLMYWGVRIGGKTWWET